MISLRSRIIFASVLALIVLAGAGATLLYFYPTARSIRDTIDISRANIQALVLQQKNLAALQQQHDQVAAAATQVQSEVWSFDTEDAFYSALQRVAMQSNVTSDDPKVSDATPTGKYLVRTVSLTFTGSTSNLLAAVNRLEAVQPSIVITALSFQSSGASTTVAISAQTVWQ